MKLRIATFNLENLFSRPKAMEDEIGLRGQEAIDDHAELNNIIAKELYSDHDKQRLLELDKRYGFSNLNAPKKALVILNKVRGSLFRNTKDKVTDKRTIVVAAKGRATWTGWFQLKTEDVKWIATYNTGRVIAEVKPDILICIEVENRPTLKRFNEQVLKAKFKSNYPYYMVIDGNDDRGIDVGIMSKYPIKSIRSHVDDLNPNGEYTFSRDCPEYVIELDEQKQILVIPNHFKSKRSMSSTDTASSDAKRLAQASAAIAIAKNALNTTPYVLLGGDLNDSPESAPLKPLFAGDFKDVQAHPQYPKDRPGTYGTGLAINKLDYLIMSDALFKKLKDTGIERRGSYHPNTWAPFDTVKGKNDEASDHHLVWADFEL